VAYIGRALQARSWIRRHVIIVRAAASLTRPRIDGLASVGTGPRRAPRADREPVSNAWNAHRHRRLKIVGPAPYSRRMSLSASDSYDAPGGPALHPASDVDSAATPSVAAAAQQSELTPPELAKAATDALSPIRRLVMMQQRMLLDGGRLAQ